MAAADDPTRTGLQSAAERSRRLAFRSAAVAGGIAVAITAFRATSDIGPGPGMTPIAIAGFGAAFGGPAIVGAIGVWTGRREPVVAAGVALMPMAILSIVAVVLMVPATLLIYAGFQLPGRSTGGSPEPSAGTDGWRLARSVLAWGRIAALAILLIGSLAGLLATMETVCWDRFPDGHLETRPSTAAESTVQVAIVGEASGCDGGVISSAGAVISLGGVGAAVAVAAWLGRRPKERGGGG